MGRKGFIYSLIFLFQVSLCYAGFSTDKLGIGTTSPVSKLDIIANGTSTNRTIVIQDSLKRDKVTILDNGNVGIGDTIPMARLQVVGAGSDTGTVLRIQSLNKSDKVTILDNGNIGIGTTSPNAPLEIIITGFAPD